MAAPLDRTMTAFPAPEEVFSGDVAAHRKVLQPLLSIEASTIDPTWTGKLHFVTPLEPYDGLLGEGAPEFYDGSVQENWIAFRVADSKYEFLGDFRYFEINRDPSAFFNEMYAQKEASYAETARLFRETGELRAAGNRELVVDFFEQIGGEPGDGNWSSFGLAVEFDDDGNAFPLTPDGRRFRFVGSLTGFNYRVECADSILLFFDPATSIAALTFDWT